MPSQHGPECCVKVGNTLNQCTNCAWCKIKCLNDLNVMQHWVVMKKTMATKTGSSKKCPCKDSNNDDEDKELQKAKKTQRLPQRATREIVEGNGLEELAQRMERIERKLVENFGKLCRVIEEGFRGLYESSEGLGKE